jgi:hypothetical protein
MEMLKNSIIKRKNEILASLVLVAIIIVPFVTFASGRNDIYVDLKATGTEDGSSAHPYKTISEALVHANKKTDVHVAKGTYVDNIEIPSGVRIFGSSMNDVVIKAKNSKKVVVSMKNDTEINKLTIEKGNEGVWIKKDAQVSIIKCVVKNNKEDGIKIESGSVKDNNAVSITDSYVLNNGRAGIFSQKRRLVLINNEIADNDSDGIDIEAGSSAWIKGNSFKNNDGSGLKLKLDGSNIWTKSNSFRSNNHEGIEVNAFGKAGRIDVAKSKFNANERYAIARINKAQVGTSIWNGFTVANDNVFEKTKQGNVSPIILVR